MRRVRQPDAIDDRIHPARRGARGPRLAQVGRKDLRVLHLAERLLQLLPRTADRAEADAAPLQFRSNRFADGAGRAEDRNVLHVYQRSASQGAPATILWYFMQFRSVSFSLSVRFRPFAAEAPKLRLPDDIRPVRYAADLTLVPGEKTFSGAIDIDIELAKPASLIWLNATELTIRQATIGSQAAAIEPGNDDFVGLRPAKTLAAGKARIHIAYQGKISEKSSAGIFQGLDGKQPYLFTQFESIDARRAFPCFDQPDFKTPWQITVHVRKEHSAISNTSPVSRNRRAQRHEEGGLRAHSSAVELPGGGGGGSIRFRGRGEGRHAPHPGAHRDAEGKSQPGQIRRGKSPPP